MLRILITLTSIIIISCSTLSPKGENYYRVAGKANKILTQYLPLESWGSGAMMPKKIESYVGIFNAKSPITTEEARIILIQSSFLILQQFNSDIKIQEFLIKRPFDKDNILLSIYYFNPNSNAKMSVTLVNGKLYFDQIDFSTGTNTTLLEETYEEAVKKAGLSN